MVKKRVLCFGDSNTYGYDVNTNGRFEDELRWTGVLAKELGDHFTVIEEGLPGRTAVFDDPLGEGLSGIQYICPCLKTHNPIDLLIIMLGTNDTKQRFSATAKNIADGLSRLTLKAQQTACWRKKPRILLVVPPPITSDVTGGIFSEEMGDGCIQKSRDLAKHFSDVARWLHCDFMDAAPFCEMSSRDGMHLTKTAHQSLGLALTKKVEELLK